MAMLIIQAFIFPRGWGILTVVILWLFLSQHGEFDFFVFWWNVSTKYSWDWWECFAGILLETKVKGSPKLLQFILEEHKCLYQISIHPVFVEKKMTCQPHGDTRGNVRESVNSIVLDQSARPAEQTLSSLDAASMAKNYNPYLQVHVPANGWALPVLAAYSRFPSFHIPTGSSDSRVMSPILLCWLKTFQELRHIDFFWVAACSLFHLLPPFALVLNPLCLSTPPRTHPWLLLWRELHYILLSVSASG